MKYEIKQYEHKVTIKEPADRPSKEILALRVQLMRKALEKMLERETNRILSNENRQKLTDF